MVDIVAFIPLRGGSKGIPQKNIKLMAGRPLAYWSIKAAVDCPLIKQVVVSTDCATIREVLRPLFPSKVIFCARSQETATDTATTESALLEYFTKRPSKFVILIQATSPLLTAVHLEGALKKFFISRCDSLLSVVRTKRFLWKELNGKVVPQNYSPKKRIRRQDFSGQLVENGSFYITTHANLIKSSCRISGNIGFFEMPGDSYIEIDEPFDWEIVEMLLVNSRTASLDKLKNIRIFATDIDGVLTDAGMYYSEKGDELKKFNTKDGMGLAILRELGIKIGAITSEKRALNSRRSTKLKLDFMYQGVSSKNNVLMEICAKYSVSPTEVAYIGDDLNDLEIIRHVGFSFCPQDADYEVKSLVDYVCSNNGGAGAVRESCNLIAKIFAQKAK